MRLPLRRVFALVAFASMLHASPARSAWQTEPAFDVYAAKGSILVADVARDRFLSLNTFGDPFSYPTPRYDVFAIPMEGASGWAPVAVEGFAPPRTETPIYAQDPGRDRILLVDDFDPQEPGLEVYALELSPVPSWHRLTPAGTPPVPREFASLTYDPLGDRLFLFGGRIGLDRTNELWELRFTPNLEWRRIDAAGLVPPALELAPMTFDAPHQRLIVVQPSSNDPQPGSPAMAWTLDVSGDLPAWDVQIPGGQQPPAGSLGIQSVRDSTNNLFLIEARPQIDAWGLRLLPDMHWIQFGPVGAQKPTFATGTLAFDEHRTRLFSFYSAFEATRFGFTDPVPGYTNLRVPGARSSNAFKSIAFDPVARSAVAQDPSGSQRLVRYAGGWAWEARIPLGHSSFTMNGTSWDARAHRALRFEYTSPSLLTYSIDPDSTNPWALMPATNAPTGSRHDAAVAYDSTTGTTYLYGGETNLADLWQFHVFGGTGAWSLKSASGGPAVFGASMVVDPVRGRLVLFGGASSTGPKNQVWAFSFAANTWSLVNWQGTGPLPRTGAAIAYDSIGDRLLIAGGRNGGTFYTDAFALSLSDPSPTWIPLGSYASPTYPALGFFDAVDNEFVVIDQPLHVFSFDAAPSLTVNAPAAIPGAPAGTLTIPLTLLQDGLGSVNCAYEITSERVWPGLPRSGSFQLVSVPNTTLDLKVAVPDSAAQGTNRVRVVVTALDGSGAVDTATVAINVSAIPAPVLACGGDVTWTPGTNALLAYVVDNASPATGPITYRLTIDRAWPGLPIEGQADLPGNGSKLLPLLVPVPDTVAVGAVVAHLVVAPAARPKATDECFRHLHDATTPALLSVIESDVAADGSSVRLTWWSQTAASSEVTIERRPDGGVFAPIGTARGDASGFVVFEDRDLPGPGRYAYRAGRTDLPVTEWSPAFWVDIPAAALAFAQGSNVRRGAFDVEFIAPSAATVTLDAYDVRGRRVASRRLDQVSPGRNLVRLAAPNTAASGVYFVRLTQGEKRVTGRIILLRDGS